jgi:hypothetical protein
VADADEAFGEQVQQEAAQELLAANARWKARIFVTAVYLYFLFSPRKFRSSV